MSMFCYPMPFYHVLYSKCQLPTSVVTLVKVISKMQFDWLFDNKRLTHCSQEPPLSKLNENLLNSGSLPRENRAKD